MHVTQIGVTSVRIIIISWIIIGILASISLKATPEVHSRTGYITPGPHDLTVIRANQRRCTGHRIWGTWIAVCHIIVHRDTILHAVGRDQRIVVQYQKNRQNKTRPGHTRAHLQPVVLYPFQILARDEH